MTKGTVVVGFVGSSKIVAGDREVNIRIAECYRNENINCTGKKVLEGCGYPI
jgi:hypothetical protein